MWKATVLAVTVCGALLSGCVSRNVYDKAVAETETTRAELTRRSALLDQASKDGEGLRETLAERRERFALLTADLAALQALSADQSDESRHRITDLQNRLEGLRAAERAAQARAELYENLAIRLRKQTDAGDLSVVLRDGRMVLRLPNDVLFDSGGTELKTAGRTTLDAVAEVIRWLPTSRFQVSGHTDNVPIHGARFSSNWELSASRALGVVHFLIANGVDPSMLSAAGYSDTDPIAPNDDPDGRRRNRRTEITLQPNIDELVKVP